MTKKIGLIGKNISYSFSPSYFSEKFKQLGIEEKWQYEILDIPDETQLPIVLSNDEFTGFNVTIPYKKIIHKYLDELCKEAHQIGAVNTIVKTNGRLIGHNTDAYGFERSLLSLLKPQNKKALILGNGGASKAVQFVFQKLGIKYQIIQRNTPNDFSSLNAKLVQEHSVIVQTTPVGTFPQTENSLPFPFKYLSPEHLVYDLIYNPLETQFLSNAKKQGATIKNGLEMLHLQADRAWELWNNV